MTPLERADEIINLNRRAIDSDFRGNIQSDIIAAISAAVDKERMRCAKIAEGRQRHHDEHCSKECKCADWFHIAGAIRAQTPDPV